MYAAISFRTVGRNGGGIGFSPAKPARVSTCACTLPPKCATVPSHTSPPQASPGMKRIGRPWPLTCTENAVGLNGGGAGSAGGVDLAPHAASRKKTRARFMAEVCHRRAAGSPRRGAPGGHGRAVVVQDELVAGESQADVGLLRAAEHVVAEIDEPLARRVVHARPHRPVLVVDGEDEPVEAPVAAEGRDAIGGDRPGRAAGVEDAAGGAAGVEAEARDAAARGVGEDDDGDALVAKMGEAGDEAGAAAEVAERGAAVERLEVRAQTERDRPSASACGVSIAVTVSGRRSLPETSAWAKRARSGALAHTDALPSPAGTTN